MSDGLNRVMLLGNLGADPELRFTQGGQAVLNMRLAINESYLDKDKVRRERVEWVAVVVWGKRGEALAKLLTKGSSVFVEGSLRSSSYDDRDGNKRYKTEINANNIVLTGGRGGERGGNEDDAGRAAPPAARGGGGYAARPSASTGSAGGGTKSSGGVAYPGVKSAGDFEIRFGDDNGKRISEVENLSGLRAFLVKGIDDPARSQYAERNKAQVNAIDEEMARRKGGAVSGSAPADDFDGGYGSGGSDDDIPF